MPKRKMPRDVNQRAKSILDIVTGERDDVVKDDRDPAAVALGRKGGLARAKVTSAKRRREIANQGAKARWKKKG